MTACEGVLTALLTGTGEVPRETSTDVGDDPFSRFISLRNSTATAARNSPDCVHTTSLTGQLLSLQGNLTTPGTVSGNLSNIVEMSAKIIFFFWEINYTFAITRLFSSLVLVSLFEFCISWYTACGTFIYYYTL